MHGDLLAAARRPAATRRPVTANRPGCVLPATARPPAVPATQRPRRPPATEVPATRGWRTRRLPTRVRPPDTPGGRRCRPAAPRPPPRLQAAHGAVEGDGQRGPQRQDPGRRHPTACHRGPIHHPALHRRHAVDHQSTRHGEHHQSHLVATTRRQRQMHANEQRRGQHAGPCITPSGGDHRDEPHDLVAGHIEQRPPCGLPDSKCGKTGGRHPPALPAQVPTQGAGS